MSVVAQWSPDPSGRHEWRYWDGERWTEHVSDAGVVGADKPPIGSPPPSEPDGAGGKTSVVIDIVDVDEATHRLGPSTLVADVTIDANAPTSLGCFLSTAEPIRFATYALLELISGDGSVLKGSAEVVVTDTRIVAAINDGRAGGETLTSMCIGLLQISLDDVRALAIPTTRGRGTAVVFDAGGPALAMEEIHVFSGGNGRPDRQKDCTALGRGIAALVAKQTQRKQRQEIDRNKNHMVYFDGER